MLEASVSQTVKCIWKASTAAWLLCPFVMCTVCRPCYVGHLHLLRGLGALERCIAVYTMPGNPQGHSLVMCKLCTGHSRQNGSLPALY